MRLDRMRLGNRAPWRCAPGAQSGTPTRHPRHCWLQSLWNLVASKRLEDLGRNGSQNGETQNRNETNRETTRDDLRLEKFEVRSRIFQGKSFRVENIAQVIFASDSSWDFDTSDRPKKSFFLVFAIWVAAHQLVKHTAGFLPCPVTRRCFKHERL